MSGLRQRGFTLIEVLIAVGITAVIGAMALGAFSRSAAARQSVEEQDERVSGARAALGRMARDVSSAFLSDHFDRQRFRDRPTVFKGRDGGDRDSLLFATMAHGRAVRDARESDQSVVEYLRRLRPGGSGRAGALPAGEAAHRRRARPGRREVAPPPPRGGLRRGVLGLAEAGVGPRLVHRPGGPDAPPSPCQDEAHPADARRQGPESSRPRPASPSSVPWTSRMTTLRPRARRERGAALLLVLMVVAVVTVLATELAYDTRVSLQIAANARDELRASYQARGAVALSRLVLHFQQRLDQAGGAAGQVLAGIQAAQGGAGTPGGGRARAPSPSGSGTPSRSTTRPSACCSGPPLGPRRGRRPTRASRPPSRTRSGR